MRAAARERGFLRMTMSMSWSRAVRSVINRSTEKTVELVVAQGGYLGLVEAEARRGFSLGQVLGIHDLVERIGEPELGLPLLCVGEP